MGLFVQLLQGPKQDLPYPNLTYSDFPNLPIHAQIYFILPYPIPPLPTLPDTDHP